MNEMIIWSPGVPLSAIEKQVILKAFQFYRGNKTATSNALGISIRTLDTRLEEYQMTEEQRKEADEKRRADRDAQLIRCRGPHSIAVGTPPYEREAQDRSKERLPSNARVRVEPTLEVPQKQPVPVPEQKEVQGVLPKETAARGHQKAR